MRHPAAAWFVVLLGLAGCGGPDLSAEVAVYADHRSSEAFFACQCPEDLGYASYEACTAALGEVVESEQACMADVLSTQGDAGKAYIDCVNEVWSMHRDCLMSNPGCEPGWYDSCAADRTAADNACTQVDQATQIEFSLCDMD